MTIYIAFLRGINVGGHKIIPMEALRKCFGSCALENVRSYIQSGNLIFESSEKPGVLHKKIEQRLKKQFKEDISVLLRTVPQLEKTMEVFSNVYKKDEKCYITFTTKKLSAKIPLFSPKKDVEIRAINNMDAITIAHEIKGRYGFPNKFIEDEYDVTATTRNCNTVRKMIDLAKH